MLDQEFTPRRECRTNRIVLVLHKVKCVGNSAASEAAGQATDVLFAKEKGCSSASAPETNWKTLKAWQTS